MFLIRPKSCFSAPDFTSSLPVVGLKKQKKNPCPIFFPRWRSQKKANNRLSTLTRDPKVTRQTEWVFRYSRRMRDFLHICKKGLVGEISPFSFKIAGKIRANDSFVGFATFGRRRFSFVRMQAKQIANPFFFSSSTINADLPKDNIALSVQ